MNLNITAAFDAGNIIVDHATDPTDIRLQIRKDTNSDFLQWFHFRMTGAKNTECTFRLTNAANAAYTCLLYTSPSPRDRQKSRMPSSA